MSLPHDESRKITHTLFKVSAALSTSLNTVGTPPTSIQNRLIDGGVGDAARGYNFGSSSSRCLGAFITSGGKLVVVYLVVVTTVVWVTGTEDNCPRRNSEGCLILVCTSVVVFSIRKGSLSARDFGLGKDIEDVVDVKEGYADGERYDSASLCGNGGDSISARKLIQVRYWQKLAFMMKLEDRWNTRWTRGKARSFRCREGIRPNTFSCRI